MFVMDKDNIKQNIKSTLEYIGENSNRDGLKETPDRVIKMYDEIFAGYKQDGDSLVKVFDSEEYEGLVVVKDIEFFSHCEHHMVPFFGRVHIGYVPNGKIIGLSKFGRIVDMFSKRLQVQERLTKDILTFIQEKLKPEGVIVQIEATHLCMVMRGIKKTTSTTVTIKSSGVLSESGNKLREEFFNSIKI